jgi:excisionase family DNA binding protein
LDVIIDLDRQGWAHLATALRAHQVWCRDNGIPVPDDIRSLLEIALAHDRERQGPTPVGDSGELLHAALMQSKLAVTYAETADRLGVSKRTVERMVERGELQSVDVGGAPRIRVVDLEAYVASLAPGRRDFRDGITRKKAS